MDKPHWRCPRCDKSRYHIWPDKTISCNSCGYVDTDNPTVESKCDA